MIINPYIYGVATSYDPDAQLFFNAQSGAGVTLTITQKDAVNQWVVDSKAIGIWTKFTAVYPMVGSTSTSQKFNLKNPLNTNAAFRLSFLGGGTHSSNGWQPNGINAYAETFITALAQNSTHLSYYSRTNANTDSVDMGFTGLNGVTNRLAIRNSGSGGCYAIINSPGFTPTAIAVADSRGFFMANRTASNILKTFRNQNILTTYTVASTGVPNVFNLLLGCTANSSGSTINASNKECAFATIGSGLTDLESQLFYQITEKYQVALGRNVNTTQSFYYNSAYNNETNAFLFSTQITDNTIQTATNTLVSDLKTAGVYTKMKALYPMVGGTATTHKFNLINPQDSDAAFRLNFVGGWTPSATGMTPNGVNAYADTFLAPSVAPLTNNSTHISIYSRTNSMSIATDIGSLTGTGLLNINTRYSDGNLYADQYNFSTNRITIANANSQGFYLSSRTSSTVFKVFKNNAQFGSTVTNVSTPNVTTITNKIYLSALNNGGTTVNYSNRELAFASIGDGLTDAEALAFYNAVQLFNTTLTRNV